MTPDYTADNMRSGAGPSWSEGLFHIHSRFSSDGKLSLAELKAECLARGLQFMVVTDHAEDMVPAELQRYVSQCRALTDGDFLAVPGLEFRVPGNEDIHLLVAGWDSSPGNGPACEILAGAMSVRNGSLVVLAHPFKAKSCWPPHIEQALDGVEIWNASCDSRYLPDHRAVRAYLRFKSRNPGLVGIGGLDLHDRSGFRGVRVRVKGRCSGTADLIKRIRAGEFETAGPCLKVRSSPEYGNMALALLSAGRAALIAADRILSAARGGKKTR